jgi:uncharacterized membrane protein
VRNAHPRSEGGTGRLQALTDGFYAVTMTLLVLDLSADERGEAAAVILPLVPLTGVSYRLQHHLSRTAGRRRGHASG